jgi:DNA-binding IclR family transcriptional regulator
VDPKLAEIDPNTSAFKILVYLTFKDKPMKPIEISKGLREKGSTVRARLTELKKKGLIKNTNEGYLSCITSYEILMKLFRTNLK